VDIDTWGASAEWLTVKPGTSFCSNLDAFAMARSGRVNTVILGAFQVAENGDLASAWSPAMGAPGVGGAMDLVSGPSRVIILMEHTTKDNKPRIVRECSYPLTALRCVSLIITDLAVIEVTPHGLVLREVAAGWTPAEVQALTEPTLATSPELKEIEM
jgi:3-oxoacid CoA-transferase subunit B